ncbi:hypothetical protein ACWF5H_01445 [Arthrobacter sp. NPDC055138]
MVHTRFWLQREAGLQEIDGFLPDLESSWLGAAGSSRGLLTYSDITAARCLVMLGPPGAGKTSYIEQHQPLLPAEVNAVLHKVDLGLYGSEDRLVRNLTESPAVIAWTEGGDELCLLLDGLDEVQQRIPHFASVLTSLLDEWPLDRLWFRVACRSAEWPPVLDQWAKKTWPDAAIVELAPFRRRDAITAAADLPDAETFVAGIERRGLAPLAALPLSLSLLLRSYETNGRIPEDRAEAYAEGLQAMCEEASPRRRTTGFSESSTPPSVVLDAGTEAAAAMVFSGRQGLWTGHSAESPAGDLSTNELFTFAAGALPAMTPTVMADLVRSSLFHGAGAERLVWSHATFPEFLAAQWCLVHHLVRQQVQSMLLADDGKVVPRLRRVAAWLVSMSPSAYAWIAHTDPEGIATEIDVPDDALRQAVVDGLLKEASAGALIREWGVTYENLRHASLADQLRPYLLEGADTARDLAVQLAVDGHAVELTNDLLTIALHPREPEHLRYRCILALIGLDWQGNELADLLESPDLLGDDSNRELRGAILEASWPQVLSTSEALDHISVPPKPWFIGHYALVVTQISKALGPNEVEAAARWLNRPFADSEFHAELKDACLALCSDHLEQPAARTAALTAVRRRLKQFRPIRGERGERVAPWPDARRHALILALIEEADSQELIGLVDHQGEGDILHPKDLPWLITQLDQSREAGTEALETLIVHLFNPNNLEHANTLASLPEDHPLVTGSLKHWCGSIDLNSPQAAHQREQWESFTLPRRRKSDAEVSQSDEVDQWIAHNLDLFEQGDAPAYAHALRLITVRPGTRKFWEEYKSDPMAHPRWQAMEEQTCQRFTEGARKYLDIATCGEPEIWEAPGQLTPAAAGAYRAFVLLLRTHPHELENLNPEIWRKWAPALVFWRFTYDEASQSDKRVLIQHALPHARAELQQAVTALISTAEREGQVLSVNAEADLVWDDDLAAELAGLLARGLPDQTQAATAGLLISHTPRLARSILTSWLQPSAIAEDARRATLAFNLLLQGDGKNSWPALREVLDHAPEIAEQAILDLAYSRHRSGFDLCDDQLAYLYEWMDARFPSEEDPNVEGAHTVSPRELAGRLRQQLLDTLVASGTSAACEILRRMADAHPEQSWRKVVLSKARKSRRNTVWEPVPIDNLRQLGRSPRARLVNSREQLAALVQETLIPVQDLLTGETPESHLLWDTRVMRPKSEDEISDYLMHRLRNRLEGEGVIINREVQVRRSRPSGIPERTDLRIEAFDNAQSQASLFRVVVEVKGAWNVELMTAINDQLVKHYLQDIRPAYGLYIVLWPDHDSWANDVSATERRRLANLDRQEVETLLSQQAEEASLAGDPVEVVHLDIPYRRLVQHYNR